MTSTRRLAAALAAAGLVASALASVPVAAGATASGEAGSTSTPQTSPVRPAEVRSEVDAVRLKRRTTMSGWSRTTYRATTSKPTRTWTFTVRVSGPAGRRVLLQKLVDGTWTTYARTRAGTSASRAFTVTVVAPRGVTRVRLRFAATTGWRAAVTATKTFVVTKPGSGPVVPPPPDPPVDPPPDPGAPSAQHYTFLDSVPITTPGDAVRWDRCTPIRWSADFTRATAAAGLDAAAERTRWDAVLAEASARTGYTFTYVDAGAGAGTVGSNGYVTGFPSTGAYASTDLVVTYASATDPGSYLAPGLDGTVIGYAGPAWTTVAGGQRAVAGQVLIDYSDVLELSLDGADLTSLYLHELGHVLGLDHYLDTTQVMNPFVASPPVTAYGDGDRTGLHALASQPCFTALASPALRTTTRR